VAETYKGDFDMSEDTPANKPVRVNVQGTTDSASPTVIVFPGNRGLCSCGWMGHPRWFVYWARIDDQIHAQETGHNLATPLVWEPTNRPYRPGPLGSEG
jgi:hypothetical protein